jgi:phosphate transport system substrate-binding protein
MPSADTRPPSWRRSVPVRLLRSGPLPRWTVAARLAVVLVGLAAVTPAHAVDPAPQATAVDPLAELQSLPYQPTAAVSGTLRLAGSSTLEQAAAHWADGFTRIHPQVVCPLAGGGSDAGVKAVREGRADVALASRPLTAAERDEWQRQTGHAPRVIAVGFDRLAWIVHADNPVAEFVWSPERGFLRPGGAAAAADDGAGAEHWGRLIGSTDWKDVPIRLHGTELGSGTRWHMDRLLAGEAACPLPVTEHAGAAAVAEAVAADRGGLGLVSAAHAHWPGVRLVPLAVPADLPPLPDAVAGSERTPDCRPLFIVVDGPAATSPLLREFLAYVLSHAGQLDVAKDGLLPLSRAELHAQRELLGWPVNR